MKTCRKMAKKQKKCKNTEPKKKALYSPVLVTKTRLSDLRIFL